MMNKTGAFIRVEREGQWVNIDIADASPIELDQLEQRRPEMGWKWVHFLVKWIQATIEFGDDNDDDPAQE